MVHEDFNQVAVRPQIEHHLRQRAAHGAAPGPRHHHGGRDPRHRDGGATPSRPRSPDTSCSPRCTPTTRPPRSRACWTWASRTSCITSHAHRHPGPAPGARELHALHRGVRADRGGGGRAAHGPRRSCRPTSFKRGRGCLHCRETGYIGPHGHLRGPADQREDPAPGRLAGGLARDLQGGARGGHAHAARGGDREGVPGRSPPRPRWSASPASDCACRPWTT